MQSLSQQNGPGFLRMIMPLVCIIEELQAELPCCGVVRHRTWLSTQPTMLAHKVSTEQHWRTM